MSNLMFYAWILENKIEFFEGDKKLDVKTKKCDDASEKAWLDCGASEVDKYVWRLERHLANQAKDYVAVKSAVRQDNEELSHLEFFLALGRNVVSIADFCLGVHVSGERDCPVKVWVDADIESIAQHYEGKRKGELVNFNKSRKIDISRWAKKMSAFERDWNIALCSAWGGFVGYPGYEWPRTSKQFEVCCADHATGIMIGSKEQLTRYEVFAKKYAGCRDEINSMLALFR